MGLTNEGRQHLLLHVLQEQAHDMSYSMHVSARARIFVSKSGRNLKIRIHPPFEELQSSLPIGVCISRRLCILYYVVCNVCHVVVPTKSVSLHAVVSKKHCVAALRDGL